MPRPHFVSKPSTLLSVATLALAGVLATVAPSGASAEPITYVAMGDSFSAGSGVLPLAPGAVPACLQSARNYPHLVAESIGAELKDVTCGGAETSHFFKAQYGFVDPQLNALSADTDLVTIGIGGNDGGTFIGAVLTCGGLGVLSLGLGSPCKDGFAATFQSKIDHVVYPNVVRALEAVHAKAPNAEVFLVGTPWVAPKAFVPSCYLAAPIARGDVPYLRQFQADLNAAFERAALATGTTYVDFARASDGHDICQKPALRWVEPALGGNNFVHPNARGEAGMAAEVLAMISPYR